MTAQDRPRRPWDRTPVDEREYFEVLGPGLVAVLPGRPPDRSGRGGYRPPTGGAWLHLGHDGRVRAFTGKVEVGQGTRAALTAVAAAELHAPASHVDVVMGDTDLCPWDMGTFGSRSMPDVAPAIAAVASGARQALLGLAAERTGTPPTELDAVDGEVRPRGAGGPALPYGELVRDRDRTITVDALSAWTPSHGSPAAGLAAWPFGEAIVTGLRVYGSDLPRPGLRHGAILHPPRYGAKLSSVDLARARAVPGVTIVQDGDFLGAVAPTRAGARAAIEAVSADWQEAPQPSEASIEAYLRSHPEPGDSWDRADRTVGDVEAAMAGAPFTLAEVYRTAYIAHVPLETRCATAEWEGSRVTVWAGTQTPFRVRDALAEALGVPVDDVRVIVPPTGSGFGGKHGADVAIPAARLARAAGGPVRVAYSREEEFRWGYLRPMSIVEVRAAADRAGRLVAWSFHNVNGGAAALMPPYRVPNQKVTNELSRSPLPQGSYRSLAAAPNNFARETAVDELARLAGRDPLEFRRENLGDERLGAVLERAVARAAWESWAPARGRGHGVAVGLEKEGRVATVAEVSVEEGRVRVDRLVTAFEGGAVVHPGNLRSQVEGALVMGVGGALFEAIRFEDGRVRNGRLAEYRVPRFSDLPALEVDLVDRPDLPPTGAGETPMIAVAPAIGNALFDATGQRLRALPLTQDGVLPRHRAG